MNPAPGWYSDPAGSGQMRFWNGQQWTSATSAIPPPRQHAPTAPPPHAMAATAAAAADASVGTRPGEAVQPPGPESGYSVTIGLSTPISSSPQGSPGARRRKFVVAGLTALVVAAAVAVPTVLRSHKSSLSSAFQRSLLTPSTVSALAGEKFTIDPVTAQSPDDNPSAQCVDVANPVGSAKDERGRAVRGFSSADHATFVIEILSNNPSYPRAMDQLRSAMTSCHTTSYSGASVSLEPLTLPPIAGSDDALGMEMTGQVSGTTLVMDMVIARHGDNLVAVMAGQIDPLQSPQNLANSLLTQAVRSAYPAFPKS